MPSNFCIESVDATFTVGVTDLSYPVIEFEISCHIGDSYESQSFFLTRQEAAQLRDWLDKELG